MIAAKSNSGLMIKSVVKALSILDLFVSTRQPLSATAISRETGLNFSTTHHLVATLRECGYLEQDAASRRYRLGPRALQLALAAEDLLELPERARPVLRELALRVRESANIAVLDGGEVVYVGQASSPAPIRMFTRIGARAPVHCTGVGKVFLAFRPEEEAMVLASASGYTRFTNTTITEWQSLRQELQRIREQGWSVDREEREEGVACVAAPVRDASGSVCAALSVSGPAGRILQRLGSLSSEVTRAAQRLSLDLGHGLRGMLD